MENESEQTKIESEIDKAKIGVGTKESISLKPFPVKVLAYRIEMQRDKANNKDIGEKVVLKCQYKDKDEPIEISQVAYKKGKEIKTSGLWFNLDEDKLIPKQSALAQFLIFLGVQCIEEIVGKEVPTELDEKNYLCFKAY